MASEANEPGSEHAARSPRIARRSRHDYPDSLLGRRWRITRKGVLQTPGASPGAPARPHAAEKVAPAARAPRCAGRPAARDALGRALDAPHRPEPAALRARAARPHPDAAAMAARDAPLPGPAGGAPLPALAVGSRGHRGRPGGRRPAAAARARAGAAASRSLAG